MTEPKWRHIDEVTEEMYREGSWVIPIKDGIHQSRNPKTTELEYFAGHSTQVYGPIPDPPKPPPKLRRFEATWDGIPVSGVKIEGTDSLQVFYKNHCRGSRYEHELTDVKWLDPEEA